MKNLSAIRQDLSAKLVEREVTCCVSGLMSGILAASQEMNYNNFINAFGIDSDELMELFLQKDFEEAARTFILDDADVEQLETIADNFGYWSDVIEDCVPVLEQGTPESWWYTSKSTLVVSEIFDDEDEAQAAAIESVLPAIRSYVEDMVDDWKWVCNEFGIDPEESEIYEHWVVSDWLAEKLSAQGEVTGEVAGLTIWGRGTTGQSISMDSVIECITAELWPEEWEGKSENK